MYSAIRTFNHFNHSDVYQYPVVDTQEKALELMKRAIKDSAEAFCTMDLVSARVDMIKFSPTPYTDYEGYPEYSDKELYFWRVDRNGTYTDNINIKQWERFNNPLYCRV